VIEIADFPISRRKFSPAPPDSMSREHWPQWMGFAKFRQDIDSDPQWIVAPTSRNPPSGAAAIRRLHRGGLRLPLRNVLLCYWIAGT